MSSDNLDIERATKRSVQESLANMGISSEAFTNDENTIQIIDPPEGSTSRKRATQPSSPSLGDTNTSRQAGPSSSPDTGIPTIDEFGVCLGRRDPIYDKEGEWDCPTTRDPKGKRKGEKHSSPLNVEICIKEGCNARRPPFKTLNLGGRWKCPYSIGEDKNVRWYGLQDDRCDHRDQHAKYPSQTIRVCETCRATITSDAKRYTDDWCSKCQAISPNFSELVTPASVPGSNLRSAMTGGLVMSGGVIKTPQSSAAGSTHTAGS